VSSHPGLIDRAARQDFAVHEDEKRRAMVLRRVGEHSLSLAQAGRILALSPRQVRRIWRRFREAGDRGLAHGNRGRPSNRAYPEELKGEVLRRYQECPRKRGPTGFAEELRAQGITVDHETLRRWLVGNDLWKPGRGRHAGPQASRCRKGFGELLTLVSLPSGWASAGLPSGFFLCLRDEATFLTLWSLEPEESCAAAMRLLGAWIGRHGIPAALRCQKRFMVQMSHTPTLEQQLAGDDRLFPFSRSCTRLGIDAGVMTLSQTRSVLLDMRPLMGCLRGELRRRRAAISPARVNALLRGAVGEALNARFGARPGAIADYHVPIVDGTDLGAIFRL
jgi:hypothetical protein